MKRPVLIAILLLVMIVVIVGVDVLFLSTRFWERLIVNIAIFLVFIGFYLWFEK